ncbi:MAG: DUF374 domain-containing protein [Rickettsiales bacterium]|jgi:lysophospholipid acyltransferase (LPLAT)-like uncharacterized protein|nr:DUF374 domain-containing protein [Rickettsiales bacterium]
MTDLSTIEKKPIKTPLFKKIMNTTAANTVAAFIISLMVRFVQRFSPTEYRNVKRLQNYVRGGNPVLVALWHSRALFMNKVWREEIGLAQAPAHAIFSTHRDGRLLSSVYRFLGIKPILSDINSRTQTREVSFKVIKALEGGVSIGITPDGPRGPAMKFVTDSMFLFAKKTGVPIVPLYISATRVKFLKTWDRFMIILPFSHSVCEAGDFVYVPRDATEADIAKIRDDLTVVMREKTVALDKELLGGG